MNTLHLSHRIALVVGAAALSLAACSSAAQPPVLDPNAPGAQTPGSATAPAPEFATSVPLFSTVADLSISGEDLPSSGSFLTTVKGLAAASDAGAGSVACHPHLFVRTHEIVKRLNRHAWMLFSHVEDVVADHPKIKTGTTHVWEKTGPAGVDRKLTLTKNGDGTFAFELDLTPAGGSATKVFSGTIDDTKAGVRSVTMTFNYDALKSVEPAVEASGSMSFTATVEKGGDGGAGERRTTKIDFDKFVPDEGDPHGPRTGSFTHVREPGVGGYMIFQDDLILLCPPNPTHQVAEMSTLARWYVANGTIYGRADTMASGGQIPSGDHYYGVSCHTGAVAAAVGLSEAGYWMMKLEDGTGATVSGSAVEDQDGAAPPCSPAFGAVPTLTSNANDADPTKVPSPPFPNAW